MSISNADTVDIYTPSTLTDTFAITFDVELDASDNAEFIRVYHRDSEGTLTKLSGSGVDYSISGSNVVTTASYDTGDTIIIARETDLLQTTSLDNASAIDVEEYEETYDRLTRMIQELHDEVYRSLRLAPDDTSGDELKMPLTANRQSKIVGFDSNGDVLMYTPQNTIAGAVDINITDSSDYYSSTEVEGALSELGPLAQINVTTQAEFNACIERTGANAYKIKDNITEIYLHDGLFGGYQMDGVLESGDTYAVLSTNNCVKIAGQPGVIIDFNDSDGYIIVNTNDAVIKDITITGDGTDCSAGYTLSVTGSRTLIDNVRITNRSFDVLQKVIDGNNDSSQKYHNITIDNLTFNVTGSVIFNQCHNLVNLNLDTIDIGTDSITLTCFSACKNISNIYAESFDLSGSSSVSTILKFFNDCEIVNGFLWDNTGTTITTPHFILIDDSGKQLANISIKNIDLDNANCDFRFFYLTENVSNVYFENVDFSSATVATEFFYNCKSLSCVNFENIDTGTAAYRLMSDCENISDVLISDVADQLTIDSRPFNYCRDISNVEVTSYTYTGSANIQLFYLCDNINNLRIVDIVFASGTGTKMNIVTSSKNINNVTCENWTSHSGAMALYIIDTCYNVKNIYVKNVDITADTSQFAVVRYSEIVSNIWVDSCDFSSDSATSAKIITNCKAVSGVLVKNCTVAAGTRDIDIINASDSVSNVHLSACSVDSGDIIGLNTCKAISAITIITLTSSTGSAYSFSSCSYIAAIRTTIADNANSDYVDTDDTSVTNRYSTPVTGDAIWT